MSASVGRPVVFAALLAAAAIAIAVRSAGTRGATPPARMSWVATAHQFGPVSYRDPAGAISPDGKWIAYSEGRFLRVQPAGGGPIVDFAPGRSQIRTLVWNADSTRILADGFGAPTEWGIYDRTSRSGQSVLGGRRDLRQATWSADGKRLAAIVNEPDGQAVWTFDESGNAARAAGPRTGLAWPAWTAGGALACIAPVDGRMRVTMPCGGAAVRTEPDADAFGPIAFSRDGRVVYVALANDSGTVDLWAAPIAGGRARRMSAFDRDSYAPSVAADGSIVFKVQSYRTSVALAPASGGPTRPLAIFQSETPSWDPSGRWLGITYGSWRRIPDDARYPDIAQDAGIIAADPDEPAAKPARIVHASSSEDQSLCWSPNGRWIAFHSHKDQSDDLWLRRADDDREAPRRITFLGRGAETGWPRWSPDGRALLFTATSRAAHRNMAFVAAVDQSTGSVQASAREVPLQGVDGDVLHAEWLPDSRRLAAIVKEAPGRHAILTASLDSGAVETVYRFASEHDFPGLAVSPDGAAVAFIAPAADGVFQVFRMPIAGGSPVQVTTDRTNKTQPAWSPDGRSIAFTVWSYDAQFWRSWN